jgi:hypothetical protein
LRGSPPVARDARKTKAPLARVFDDAAPESLVRRSRALLTLLGTQGLRESYFRTFWLPLQQAPAHAIEELVLALWPLANPSAQCRGAEWWLGRTYTNRIPIGFHFDQDVKAEARFRHPELSSVFFFNAVRGGQLAITDQGPGPRGDPRPALAGEMIAVAPKRNRYTIFEGDRFHGVLDANGRVPTRAIEGPPGRMRLTLVVNFWNARPTDVPRWSESRAYPRLR